MAGMDLNERVTSWDGKRWLQCLKCETSLVGYQADSSEFIVTRMLVSKGYPQADSQEVHLGYSGNILFLCGMRDNVGGLLNQALEATVQVQDSEGD